MITATIANGKRISVKTIFCHSPEEEIENLLNRYKEPTF
jgi:hypothetical protein